KNAIAASMDIARFIGAPTVLTRSVNCDRPLDRRFFAARTRSRNRLDGGELGAKTGGGWGSGDGDPERCVMGTAPDGGRPSISTRTLTGQGMSACPVDIAYAERWTSTGQRVSACHGDIAHGKRCDAVVIVEIGIVPRRNDGV